MQKQDARASAVVINGSDAPFSCNRLCNGIVVAFDDNKLFTVLPEIVNQPQGVPPFCL